MPVLKSGVEVKIKNGLGKFSYFVVIASTIAGVVFASQGSASASVGNGWTATRIAKDVVTGIGFATGGVAGGATVPARTAVSSVKSVMKWFKE